MDEELVIIENPKEGENSVYAQTKGYDSEDVRLSPLVGFFDIDRKTTNKEQQQLTEIMDFLEGDTDTSVEANIYVAIRNIEEKLTSPKIGETRIGKIHDYVKTLKMIKQAEDERDSLLR